MPMSSFADRWVKRKELALRRRELLLKTHDLREKRYEMRNVFLRDTREMFARWANALLVVSGGALTVSIGIFLRKDAVATTLSVAPYLHWGWGFLSYTVVVILLMQILAVQSMELHGIRWSKWLDTKDPRPLRQASNATMMVIRIIAWSAATSFALGFALLTAAAIKLT